MIAKLGEYEKNGKLKQWVWSICHLKREVTVFIQLLPTFFFILMIKTRFKVIKKNYMYGM